MGIWSVWSRRRTPEEDSLPLARRLDELMAHGLEPTTREIEPRTSLATDKAFREAEERT